MAVDPQWLRDLVPASFAGVGFHVDTHSRTGGVRGPDHEYPDRDDGTAEGLGRKLHRYNFSAFVLGDNYHVQLDDLIVALDSGVGLLIHPRWGRIEAICRQWSTDANWRDGGIGKINLDFVERATLLGLSVSAEAEIEDYVGAVRDQALERFLAELEDLTDFPGFVGDSGLQSLLTAHARLVDAVLSPLVSITSDVVGMLDAVAGILAGAESITQLGAAIQVAFEAINDRFVVKAFAGERPAVRDDALLGDLNEAKIARVQNATNAMFQHNALASLASLTLDAAGVTIETYNEALAERDEIAELIQAEEAELVSVDEYRALLDLRVELHAQLTTAALPLVRLREITLDRVTSALLLAHDLYGDATRAGEIIERNGIVHGAFIPPGVYTVVVE